MKPLQTALLVMPLLAGLSLSAMANELNGLSVESAGNGVSVNIDAQKVPGTTVKRQGGQVVITMPKTQLPKAYQEFGLPEIKTPSGAKATVTRSSAGLVITIPNAGSGTKVKFSSGDEATVSTVTTKPVTKAPTKVTVKPVVKAAPKPVASKPSPKVLKAVTKPKPAAAVLKPPAKTVAPKLAPVVKTAATAAAVQSPVNPDKAIILPNETQAEAPVKDTAKLKPLLPELGTDETLPETLLPESPAGDDLLASVKAQLVGFFEPYFGPSVGDWILPALAIGGVALIVLAFLALVLQRLGRRGKPPVAKSPKAKPVTSKTPPQQEMPGDDFSSSSRMPDFVPSAAYEDPSPAVAQQFSAFLDSDIPVVMPASASQMTEPLTSAVSAPPPIPNMPAAALSGADETFVRLAQQKPKSRRF